jgi:DNA-binding IclR family transcriptional regulator
VLVTQVEGRCPRCKARDEARAEQRQCKACLVARDAGEVVSDSKIDIVLRDLVALWDETFYFVRINGTMPEVVLERGPEGVQRSLSVRRVWRPFSSHAGAGARAILAFATPEARDRILNDASFERFTRFTKVDRAEIFAEIDATRARGYGVNDQEFEIGALSFATPILTTDAVPPGAIGVLGVRERLLHAQERGLIASMTQASATLAASDLFEGAQ